MHLVDVMLCGVVTKRTAHCVHYMKAFKAVGTAGVGLSDNT